VSSPRFSVSEFSTLNLTWEEDLAAFAAGGAEGIGIAEAKLPEDDSTGLAQLRESGLKTTLCLPAALSILPNALGPAIVAASFAVGGGALVEAALSYLGFGVQVPIPSWGSLASESHHAGHWWLQLFPGLAILVSVAGYNLVGEAVREALDPRLAGRREGAR